MALITPQRINNLKSAVQAECLKRNYNKSSSSPSVADYGGATYYFTTTPATGLPINAEHYNKIATPMHAIHSSYPSVASVQSGAALIEEAPIALMETKIATYQTNTKGSQIDQTRTDCSAGCTGLCYGDCSGTCAGCTSCTGSCSGCTGCTGTCKGCTGCTDYCTGCTDECYGCGTACSSCTSCQGCSGCSKACKDDCKNSCSGECKGCGSGCAAGCSGRCTGCDVSCGSIGRGPG